MVEMPETRESLLLKIGEGNADAWERFVMAYRPAVYRLARRFGLQDADAEDLAQQVLVSVSKAIPEWRKDSSRGTFRGWLVTVARNACINVVTRRCPDASEGGTSVLARLQHVSVEHGIQSVIEGEHRRVVFRWAASEVQPEFSDRIWQAFWLTAVDGVSIEGVASRLDMSVGAVYAARSRVMRRLKQVVCELDPD